MAIRTFPKLKPSLARIDSAKHLPFDPVAEAPSWEPSTVFK